MTNRPGHDEFLEEQLALLRKLNDRVSKIQHDVIHNVELLAENHRIAERFRRDERVFRERSRDVTLRAPEHERRRAAQSAREPASAHDRRRCAGRRSRARPKSRGR